MLTNEQAKNIRELILRIVTRALANEEIDENENEAISDYMANCEVALKIFNEDHVERK